MALVVIHIARGEISSVVGWMDGWLSLTSG